MTKQDEYRFNLKFDEADEDHRRVSEFLNKCGRKKARYSGRVANRSIMPKKLKMYFLGCGEQ